jgi:hypothetical protein
MRNLHNIGAMNPGAALVGNPYSSFMPGIAVRLACNLLGPSA